MHYPHTITFSFDMAFLASDYVEINQASSLSDKAADTIANSRRQIVRRLIAVEFMSR